jgi:REP element-mobilizing transposase RayT
MRQLEFKGTKGWGGRRRGAGRPNRSRTVNHMKRAKIDEKKPAHITLHLKEKLTTLRRKDLLKAFARSANGANAYGLHVLHFSLQRNHFHMIIEVKNNGALADGMRSLAGRFGKAVRAVEGRTGAVFAGRYHLHVLRTPREMKNALSYVLLNRARHTDLIDHLDPYSSARHFADWRALLGKRISGLLREELESAANCERPDLGLSPPGSWLASRGWIRAA